MFIKRSTSTKLFKTFKRRITLVATLVLTVVLFLILLIFNVDMYRHQLNEIRGAMRYALDIGGSDLYIPDMEFYDGEGNIESNNRALYQGTVIVYTVEVSNTGLIVSRSDNVYVNEAVLVDSVLQILTSDEERGEIKEYSLLYETREITGGIRIAFADSEGLNSSVLSRATFSALMLLVSAVVFLIISYFIARVSVKPVENAWKSQQRFVADASHELKTPLTVMLADSDIVKMHPESTVKEQMRWIDGIHDEGIKMQGLVQDLLLLAQTEPGSYGEEDTANLEKIDLSGLVEKDVLQFEALAFERGIEFESEIEDGLNIKGDLEKVDRVVRILLDNALKYAKGAAEDSDIKNAGLSLNLDEMSADALQNVVKVSLAKGRSQAVLKVNNGGEPIPEEDLPHVFERFYRGDKARTGSGSSSGFGLGLAIAHNIVTGYGGNIDVSSDAENGTTFTVRLPLF